jgi:hypothetical protein
LFCYLLAPSDAYLSEYSTLELCIASSGARQTSLLLGKAGRSKTLLGTGCTFQIETDVPHAFGISRCCKLATKHLLLESSLPAVASISQTTPHDTITTVVTFLLPG